MSKVSDQVFGVISALRSVEHDRRALCSLEEEELKLCNGIDDQEWEIVRSVMVRADLAKIDLGVVSLTEEGRRLGDSINKFLSGMGLEDEKVVV